MAKLNLKDIHIRDPFIFTDRKSKTYYLFGTLFPDGIGTIEPHFPVFHSKDLIEWKGPGIAFYPAKGFWGVRHYWAPEVFELGNRYYMFATCKGAIGEARGTLVLISDHPSGPYKPHSDGPITPVDRESLDGTFFKDRDGKQWMVYCHEWTQIYNGTIEAVQLSNDLKCAISEPIELIRAEKQPWIRKFSDKRSKQEGYLTDAPFLYESKDGRLHLYWSSYSKKDEDEPNSGGYTVTHAVSESGHIEGPWKEDGLFLNDDMGHPSLFRSLDGDVYMCVHSPDTIHGMERTKLLLLEEKIDGLAIK